MRRDSLCIRFATTNIGKFREAVQAVSSYGIMLKMVRIKKLEIQSDELQKIVNSAVALAVAETRSPTIVEDSGLFISSLDGFPGPYSEYVYRTLGSAGIIRLLDGRKDRSAEFRSYVALSAPNLKSRIFRGVAKGTIALQPRGKHGFGFDPIFVPTDGNNRTFGQLTTNQKNSLSHRGSAFRRLASWLGRNPSVTSEKLKERSLKRLEP